MIYVRDWTTRVEMSWSECFLVQSHCCFHSNTRPWCFHCFSGDWLYSVCFFFFPQGEGTLTKGHEQTSGNGEHIYHVDCGDGFRNVDMSQLAKLYTLNVCGLLNINYNSKL